jgi:hypothetical protein
MSNGNGGTHAFTNDMRRDGSAIDAETAQRILDGEVVGPAHLARLLASIAGGGPMARSGLAEHRLPGEDEAVAAFVAARAAGAHRPGSLHAAKPKAGGRRVWSRTLSIKVAVAALVLSGGGVAVAASTGVIPNPLPGHAHGPGSAGPHPSAGPDIPAGDRVSSNSRTAGPGGSGPAGSGLAGSASASPGSSLPPDINGQCHAWLDDFARDPSVTEHNPRYARLVALAGGADKVTAYCQAYLANRAKATPSPDAVPSAQPTGSPAAKGGH